MPRALVLSLFAILVVIWSSTWVAIKFGLEDQPPLLGAGVRFVLAGAVLLAIAAVRRRPLRTDWVLVAVLAILPFALSYGLIYWSEQYIPSGLAAVLFGVMPLYAAVLSAFLLADEPVNARLFAGVGVALGGLVLGFSESLDLGHQERAALGAVAALAAPLASAIGNVSIKRRGHDLDAVVFNGWAMLFGGLLLLGASAIGEDWGAAGWTGTAIGSITYLAIIGSAFPFVVLALLLRELPSTTVAYIPLLLPFGALLFGWSLYDEELTTGAVAGAVLVAAGLLVAQFGVARRPQTEVPSANGHGGGVRLGGPRARSGTGADGVTQGDRR